MAQNRSILGTRIRERRKELKVTQADLAKNVAISASYLNLIEHNKRAIGGSLLLSVANELKMEVTELEDASERRLQAELDEIAHIPYLQTLGVEHNKTGEFIGRFPGWSRAVHALARSERESAESALLLADRLTHDSFLVDGMQKILGGLAAVRSAGEILVDFPEIDEQNKNRFQHIVAQQSGQLTDIVESLASYLEKPADLETDSTPTDAVESLFESRQNRFEEIEAIANSLLEDTQKKNLGAPAPSIFEKAINSIVNNYPRLNTELAKQEAKSALWHYAKYASLSPMDVFQTVANEMKYDIDSISEKLSLSIETVCHRLTALPKNEDMPHFGYLLANASGMFVRTRSIPTLLVPRFAPACPLWVIFRSQQSPETLIRQRVIFPDGDSFVFVARARLHGEIGFGKPRHYLSDMIVMTESSSKYTVYAPDQSVYYEPVGVSCRNCIRKNCQHRVSDPLTGRTE